MPYTISHGSNLLAIAEREYNVGATIRFTTFTSCIGVIGLNGTNLTAVHLALYDGETKFSKHAASKVLALFQDGFTAIMIMGCVDIWEQDHTLAQAYGFMTDNLKAMNNLPALQRSNLAEGAYGATVNGTAIRLLSPPNYT